LFYVFSYCQQLYQVQKFGTKYEQIRTMLPNWFLDHIFCAGLPNEADGPCHGDSGGPLAKFVDTAYPHFIQLGE
jgi:hypothetical protein